MQRDAKGEQEVTRLGESAGRVFHQVEIVAYILLGLLLAVAAVAGMGGSSFARTGLLIRATKQIAAAA